MKAKLSESQLALLNAVIDFGDESPTAPDLMEALNIKRSNNVWNTIYSLIRKKALIRENKRMSITSHGRSLMTNDVAEPYQLKTPVIGSMDEDTGAVVPVVNWFDWPEPEIRETFMPLTMEQIQYVALGPSQWSPGTLECLFWHHLRYLFGFPVDGGLAYRGKRRGTQLLDGRTRQGSDFSPDSKAWDSQNIRRSVGEYEYN